MPKSHIMNSVHSVKPTEHIHNSTICFQSYAQDVVEQISKDAVVDGVVATVQRSATRREKFRITESL